MEAASGGGGGGAKDEMPRVVTLEGERGDVYGCIISSTQAVVEAPGGELVVMCGNGKDVQHYYPYHIPGMKL